MEQFKLLNSYVIPFKDITDVISSKMIRMLSKGYLLQRGTNCFILSKIYGNVRYEDVSPIDIRGHIDSIEELHTQFYRVERVSYKAYSGKFMPDTGTDGLTECPGYVVKNGKLLFVWARVSQYLKVNSGEVLLSTDDDGCYYLGSYGERCYLGSTGVKNIKVDRGLGKFNIYIINGNGTAIKYHIGSNVICSDGNCGKYLFRYSDFCIEGTKNVLDSGRLRFNVSIDTNSKDGSSMYNASYSCCLGMGSGILDVLRTCCRVVKEFM